MHNHIIKSMRLLHLMENLKTELTQNRLSDEREESVAEHSWRVTLMVMLFGPYLDQAINMEKALKMAMIHSIAVAETGYIPPYEKSERSDTKKADEKRAIMNLKAILGNSVGQEWSDLWQELVEKSSYEAKVVCAMDKLETLMQQNEADIETWVDWNFKTNPLAAWDDCKFDSMLSQISQLIRDQVDRKMAEAGMEVREIA